MIDAIDYFMLAGVLVILELFTGTFYLLMIALGLASGGIAALLGAPLPLQLLLAAVVGAGATLVLRRSRFGIARGALEAGRDPNVNLDIGQSIDVPQWHDGAARVMYRGALWDVELAPGSTGGPGSYRIIEVRGSRLVVANR